MKSMDQGARQYFSIGLAQDGALRVRLDDGSEKSFHSGDVSVRRTGAAD